MRLLGVAARACKRHCLTPAVPPLPDTSNLDMLLGEDHVVDHVERNQVVRASEVDMEAALKAAEPTCEIQDEATWGLVRINEQKLNINGEFHYLSDTGYGVTAYIIDT